jgi:hypothetical protein
VQWKIGLGTQAPDSDFGVGSLTVVLRLAARQVASGCWAAQVHGFVPPVTNWVLYQFVCTNDDQKSEQDKLANQLT